MEHLSRICVICAPCYTSLADYRLKSDFSILLQWTELHFVLMTTEVLFSTHWTIIVLPSHRNHTHSAFVSFGCGCVCVFFAFFPYISLQWKKITTMALWRHSNLSSCYCNLIFSSCPHSLSYPSVAFIFSEEPTDENTFLHFPFRPFDLIWFIKNLYLLWRLP